jgi:hypothetical protein
MKVGDYVRTKNGRIFRWSSLCTTDIEDYMEHTRKILFIEDEIKSSQNIIDLIKVGDILVIKDFVDEACMIFTDIYLIQNEQQLLNIKNDLEKNKNKKLYSIVTKEAFESMEYKIGE